MQIRKQQAHIKEIYLQQFIECLKTAACVGGDLR
jgi:hypothetical protein